jgi:uncharacterized protein (TIGR00369 family)
MTDDLPPGYTAVHPDSTEGFSRAIGPVFLDEARGRLAFWVRDSHLNVKGFCHGGALALFADCQIAVVRGRIADLAGHTPTISLRVDYIAPVRAGQLVEMAVTLVRNTRSMLFTQAILCASGDSVGRTDAIYRWYPIKPDDDHAR